MATQDGARSIPASTPFIRLGTSHLPLTHWTSVQGSPTIERLPLGVERVDPDDHYHAHGLSSLDQGIPELRCIRSLGISALRGRESRNVGQFSRRPHTLSASVLSISTVPRSGPSCRRQLTSRSFPFKGLPLSQRSAVPRHRRSGYQATMRSTEAVYRRSLDRQSEHDVGDSLPPYTGALPMRW